MKRTWLLSLVLGAVLLWGTWASAQTTTIHALPALAAAPATDDELVIWDLSTGVTKKITVAYLFSGYGGVPATTTEGSIPVWSSTQKVLADGLAATQGALVYGSGAGTWAVLARQTAGKLLTWDASDVKATAFTLAAPGSANGLLASDGTNWVRVTAITTDVTGALTGNASTATALASNPTDCSANTYATAIAANGNLTCGQVAAAGLANADFGDFTVSSGTATIDTGAVTVGKLATSMTIGATSVWDFSAVTHSNTDVKGLLLPSCGTAQNPTSGVNYVCWDTSASSLKVYDAGWKAFAAVAAPVDVDYVTLSASATLTAERVLTAGTALDFTDGGANSTLTIDFDSTEVGTTTWGSGSGIVWTFNASDGTDVTLTFGNNLLTIAGGLTLGTGKNFIIGTTTWNSGDSIDGTKVANADLGDIGVSSGVWSVEDDSHAHGSTTITLASTNLSDTSALAYLAGAQTFTANNVFGNANSDTLTIQSTIKGSGRAVTIDDDGTTSPTYATATQSLFVTGHIETAGNVYAAAIIGGAGTNEQRGVWFTSNTSMAACYANDGLFFLNDVLTVCENGTQRDIVTPADSVTWTGASHSFAGVTNFRLPTAAADSSGEMSINATNHQLLFHVGGASGDNALQTFDFDTCSAGYVLKTDGSGNWTCAADATAGSPTLDSVGAPVADATWAIPAGTEVTFNYTGNFTTGSQFLIEQKTGNPSGGTLFEIKAADTDITLAKFGDGTNYTQFSTGGNLTLAGTAVITAGGIVLGDSTPDANGEIGYASNAFAFFANSEDMIWTAGTNTWTYSSNTGAVLQLGIPVMSPAAMAIASQATGDLLYASSASAWARLGIQAAGYVLAGGTNPAWSNAPQITTIELGAATDTTLARVSAGVISVEGSQVANVQTATIDGSAHVHLTAAQMQQSNCIVTNLGQTTADVNIGLPAAAVGLSCLFTVATAQSNHWGVLAGASDAIYIIAADGTVGTKGDDAAAAIMTAAQLGQSFACWAQATGAGPAYDWFCKAIAIGTSTFAAHAAF